MGFGRANGLAVDGERHLSSRRCSERPVLQEGEGLTIQAAAAAAERKSASSSPSSGKFLGALRGGRPGAEPRRHGKMGFEKAKGGTGQPPRDRPPNADGGMTRKSVCFLVGGGLFHGVEVA